MGYVIVRVGPESEPEYREYLLVVSRRLLNQKVGFDQVPRVPSDYDASRWRYVHESEEAANADAVVIREDTGEDGWEVLPFDGTPSVGPLQPIRINLGGSSITIVYALDSIWRQALRQRYPDSFSYSQIMARPQHDAPPITLQEIQNLAIRVLPVLTGLTIEQLSIYGGFEIVDPVKHEAVAAFIPLGQARPEDPPAAGATRPETAASPGRYTESKAG